MFNLYAIVNINKNGIVDVELVDACFKKDMEFLQIRMKNSSDDELFKVVLEILRRRNSSGARTKIIVNDNVKVAIESGADGVHLGQDDGDPQKVKKENPQLVVGLSTHDLSQIEKANNMDLDYIGFGPVFETTTKDTRDRTVFNIVPQAVDLSVHPIVFIGGINIDNIDNLPKGEKIFAASVSGLEKLAGVFNVQ